MPYQYPLYAYNGEQRAFNNIEFFTDLSELSVYGQLNCMQTIFDHIFSQISNANRFIYLDFFLINEFRLGSSEPYRELSKELIQCLLTKKSENLEIDIYLITDPINKVYGGLKNPLFDQLTDSGIEVVFTNLDTLNDSNPLYSGLWRVFASRLKIKPESQLPNPFGSGSVSIRSYLKLFNFKANHRKLLITDTFDGYQAIVTSANPHDASSAHHNTAISFDGLAVADLLESELGMIERSSDANSRLLFDLERHVQNIAKCYPVDTTSSNSRNIRVVTEGAIKNELLSRINLAAEGDEISIAMFYLSHRQVIASLKAAHYRGARIRILLDPNREAFGHAKNGIPNRQAAFELHKAGISVRWCNTHGEQFHTKLCLFHQTNGNAVIINGSANLTRRNLDNFNLETNIIVNTATDSPLYMQAIQYFDGLWYNQHGHYSCDYAAHAENNWLKWWVYRIMERSGLSTF